MREQRFQPASRPRAADDDEWFDLLTVAEVASILKTSRKAIYSMRDRGQLPEPIRIGRRVLFRRVDLVRWLSERRAVSLTGDER